MRAPRIEGKLLDLRAPATDDLPFLLAFANDAELRGWLRFWRPTSEPEERAWVEGLEASDDVVWLMVPRGADEPVGSIGLHGVDRVARHAELGLGIRGAQRRGQGIGEEASRLALRHAFESLRLERVFLHVLDDNPAIRLYARLGFKEEGRLRRHYWKRGAWHDQVVMGLLREEGSP